jgi:hypothetical protein
MNDVTRWLKQSDPLTAEPELPAIDVQVMRRAVMAVASSKSSGSPSSWSWMTVASGIAIVAAAAIVVTWHVEPTTLRPPIKAHALTTGVIIPLVTTGVSRMFDVGRGHGSAPSSTRLESRTTPSVNGEPEVLVDPREGRAMRSLLDGVLGGGIDATRLLSVPVPPIFDAEPVRDIKIAPLEWAPLTGSHDEKGVSE